MKKLASAIIIAVICFVLVACNNNTKQNQNNSNNTNNNQVVNNNQGQTNNGKDEKKNEEQNEEQNVVTKPVNEGFEMSTALTSMQAVIENTNLTKLTDDQIKEKYNFGKYEGLEKVIASKETEETISEIAMVKLGDMEQSSDILLMFVDRINDLKEKYASNPEVINLLTTQDSYIIKQQAGVAVMILGENAKAIEAEFDKNFK